MPAKTHVVKVVFLVLCLSMLALQNGCSNSGSGSGNTQAPASNGNAINLSLTTTNGFTAVVADGRSTIPIRIQITNASGTVSGVPVTFATTAGTLSASPVVRATRDVLSADPPAIPRVDSTGSVTVTTDASGIAQVLLTASTTAETAVVTADALGFRTNIVIDFVPGPPARVQLSASPTTVNAGGTSTFTATVTDANGNPVTGEVVMFSLSTNTSGATLSATSGVTNNSGQATVTYTAGFTPGADTVRALATSVSISGSTSVTVAAGGSSQVTGITTVPGAMTLVADGVGTVAIRATVSVASGSPAGIAVTFTTTAGTLSPATARTDTNGVATVNLIAGTSLGDVTVTASAVGFSATVTVTFVAGAPTVVQLSANPTTVNAGGMSTITATVTDAKGNPGTGQTLTFSPPTQGTLSALSGNTDANGQLTVMYTAGTTSTTETVQAKATNGVTGKVDITTASTPAGNVASITVVPGATSVVADGTSTVAMRATVMVTVGTPAGIPVTFTTTAGQVAPATAMTDATGVATVTLKAGSSLGTATVTASAGGFNATTMVMFVAGTPTVVQLSANPTTVNAKGTSTITASVTDAKGNPVTGQTLTFTAPTQGTLSVLGGSTNANGQLPVTYTAGATPTTETVQVKATNGITGKVDITTISAPAGSVSAITLGAGAPSVVADGTSTVAMQAKVSVTSGALAGIPVTFTTTAGSLSPTTANTDANGIAIASLTSASSVATATVTASAGGFNATTMVLFVAGTPAVVQLSANPATVNAKGASTITATVTDAKGNPVNGQTLTFTAPTKGTLSVLSGSTNTNGQLPVTYTAGATPTTETVQVKTTNDITGKVDITTTSAPGGSVSAIILSAGASSVVADGTSIVAMQAKVSVTSGALAGIPVTFATTAGSLSPTTKDTDANGVATVSLTSASSLGAAMVTASAGGFNATTTVMFVAGTPAVVQLSANPTTVNAKGTSTIIAMLTDAKGNPVNGQTLTFAAPTRGTLSPLTGNTDTNGQLTVTYTAGTTPGTETIKATTNTANGVVTGTVNLTIASSPAGSVASITLKVTETSGTPNDNIIAADGSSNATITATLLDANGVPVSDGVIVNFTTAPPTLGSISSQATTAGGTGQATATFTAGTGAGNATVTAASGAVTSAPVVITLAAGPVNSLFLKTISNTSIGVRGSGTNETSNLTFEARDSNGNLVQDPVPGNPNSGTKVSFTLDSGGLGGGESLSPPQVTAVNGQVTTTLQSGTKAGTLKVIAFIDTNGNNLPDGTEIASQATSVVITGGPPWGENLSVAVAPLNIAGLVTFGLTDKITTFLSDRFSNPVPDGTAVSFSSDFAGITGAAVSTSSGGTTAATATATLTSQGPLPPDGFVTVTPSTLSGAEARVLSLAVNPANANLVYAGTDGGGVFRTTNGLNANAAQVSWTQVGRAQTGLTNGIIRALQIDPTNTSIIYAATATGVFRSIGGGDTWAARSGREQITGEAPVTGNPPVPCIIAALPQICTLKFPSDGNRAKTTVRINGLVTLLYQFIGNQDIQLLPGAGSAGDTVSIDYDLGAVIGTPRITALALDPTNPLPTDPSATRALYAGTQGGGVFRSRDSGFSWDGINIGLSDTNILSLVAMSPTTLYAGAFGGGVFRTFNATDAVPNWCQVNNGLTSTVINTLATDGTRVYAGTFQGGVFFLTDGRPPAGVTDCGTVAAPPTWVAPTTNVNTIDILNGFVSDIIIDPNNPAMLYAATLGDGTRSIEGNAAEGGVFTSIDSGVTWTRMPVLPATQLALPPTDLPNNRAYSLGISAANSATLYVGTAGRNVVRLTPSTATFTVVNGTPPNQITNNVFVSGTVLFSGNTRVTITEIMDVFQDQNRALPPNGFGPLPDSDIFNGGSQSFIYTVADQNGNPITAGSTITVTGNPGLVTGSTGVTIPDTQQGSTVFGVAWQNNIVTTGNTGATLTVSVNSSANGSVVAAVSRLFIGPLTISPVSATLPAPAAGPPVVPGGGSVSFTVSGGSETLVSQGGGYLVAKGSGPGTISTATVSGVTSATIDGPGSFTLTVPPGTGAAGTTITVTATDRLTGKQVTATVTLQ